MFWVVGYPPGILQDESNEFWGWSWMCRSGTLVRSFVQVLFFFRVSQIGESCCLSECRLHASSKAPGKRVSSSLHILINLPLHLRHSPPVRIMHASHSHVLIHLFLDSSSLRLSSLRLTLALLSVRAQHIHLAIRGHVRVPLTCRDHI